MRTTDIRIGETYQVKVPQRIPRALRDRLPSDPHVFAAQMHLYSLRGTRFDLTVTAIADTTVDGYETTRTSRVCLPLTPEQAAGLDLAPGGTYTITGHITDEDQDDDLEFPTTLTHQGLPAAWLRPADEPVPITPAGIRYARARVQRQAAGRTAAEVATALDEALEHRRALADEALDSYRAEEWLRTAETSYSEWRRIYDQLKEKGADRYEPETDPGRVSIDDPRNTRGA